MKTGIELLVWVELILAKLCGCSRPRCEACSAHREVSEYLDAAMDRVSEGEVLQ